MEILKLPQPTISRHLSYLRRAGLVNVRQERSGNYYALRRRDRHSIQNSWSALAAASATSLKWELTRKEHRRSGNGAGAARLNFLHLTPIANAAWKSNRGGNEQKRPKSADALKDRLRWRSWEEVQ